MIPTSFSKSRWVFAAAAAALAGALAGCEEGTGPTSRRLQGEWAHTIAVQRFWFAPELCDAFGNIVVDESDQGTIATRTALGADFGCNVANGAIVDVVRSDTSAEFVIETPNCTLRGSFVNADSVTGTADCRPPFAGAIAGTWAAGRVAAAATVDVAPTTRGLAVGTTQSITGLVRDAVGRPLHYRELSWSSSNTSVLTVTDEDTAFVVRALAPGSAVLTASFGAALGSVTVQVSRQSFVAVTTGNFFSCATTASGDAWCWGWNAGQLGDGTLAAALGPVKVQGGIALNGLQAGEGHTCGLSGSAAYCWGSNYSGELGVGDRVSRRAPARVSGSTPFAEIRAGGSHSCAVATNQAVWCWGSNGFGQLGNGGVEDALVPTAIPSGFTLSHVILGSAHSCGWNATGSAWCWGINQAGVLGTGGSFEGSPQPAPVSGGHAFATMTAASATTCALDMAGATYCWGLRQPGTWQPGRDTVIVAPEAFDTQERAFTMISSSDQHSCALDSQGAAWCWGSNSESELGDGTTTSRAAPTPVVGGLRFTTIATGWAHTCGVTIDGVTYCWGHNASGQLGDGTRIDRASPVRVLGQP